MINVLALVKNWRGEVSEIETQAENFLEFFAKYKYGSFFNSRPLVALELAEKYLSVVEEFEGFKFRSADDVTEIEVVVVG